MGIVHFTLGSGEVSGIAEHYSKPLKVCVTTARTT